jgi:hypothetical protein
VRPGIDQPEALLRDRQHALRRQPMFTTFVSGLAKTRVILDVSPCFSRGDFPKALVV